MGKVLSKAIIFALFLIVGTFSVYSTESSREERNNMIKETLDYFEGKIGRDQELGEEQIMDLSRFPEEEMEYLPQPPEEIVTPKRPKPSQPKIHGYYQYRTYIDRKKDNDEEHNYEIRQDLSLDFSQRISDNLKYFVSLDGQYDLVRSSQDGFDHEEDKLQLWECYLNYFSGNLNLRLGKQAIRWGKGDEINPTDNFTPEDWTEYLNLTRAERKIPVWMIKADYSFYPYRLEGIWLPFFVASRIPLASSDWEPYIHRFYRDNILPFDVKKPERPPKNLRSQIGAIKLTKSTPTYDISLSYAYHYDEFPSLYLNLPTLTVSQLYPRQHTFGSDFETLLGKIGLRGEFAYTLGDLFVSYSPTRPDTIVAKDVFNGIIGLDYTFKNRIYTNLQYFVQYIPHHEKDMFNRSHEDSLIWKVSRQFLHDTLLLGAEGRIYLFDLDYYYQLKCEYDISDSLKLTLGYDTFFGEEDGTFGQYNKNDQFFTKLKYSF